MSVLTKSKREKKAQPIIEQDDSGLFYVDEQNRKSYEKQHEYVIEKMNFARNSYQQVTGENITTYEQFQEIVADPVVYYRKTKAEKNVTEKKPMTLALLDEGYGLEFLEEQVKLPDGFDQVISDSNNLKREKNFSWKNYAYDGMVFTMSAALYDRMLNKVYYYAATDLQKRRLTLANKFLELIPEWEELLKLEAKQAGIKESKIQRALEAKRFVGPLPFCLRYDRPMPLLGWGEVKAEIEINPDFVVHGHRPYAAQLSLHELVPTERRGEWVDKAIYKRFWRTDGDGGRRPYFVKKGLEKNAYWGAHRESDVRFDEGDFVLRDGKFIKAE